MPRVGHKVCKFRFAELKSGHCEGALYANAMHRAVRTQTTVPHQRGPLGSHIECTRGQDHH